MRRLFVLEGRVAQYYSKEVCKTNKSYTYFAIFQITIFFQFRGLISKVATCTPTHLLSEVVKPLRVSVGYSAHCLQQDLFVRITHFAPDSRPHTQTSVCHKMSTVPRETMIIHAQMIKHTHIPPCPIAGPDKCQ